MKKLLLTLFVSLLIISGCGNAATDEQPQRELTRLENILYSLPDAYFEFYFPKGTTSSNSKEQAIATLDEENGYIEFKQKSTIDGDVHWALKVFEGTDGDVIAVSDLLQDDGGQRQHLSLLREVDGAWNDDTKALFQDVMDAASRIPLKERVMDYYDDDIEVVKLRSGSFLFSAESDSMTSAIANKWELELPLYKVNWDGSAFSLEEIEGTPASETNES